jgi:hypothetical protein
MHELQHIVVVELPRLGVRNEIFVIHEPRRVREQVADADVAAVRRKAGKHIGDAVVVVKFPVLHEEHDGHRGERLGERSQAKVGVHGGRLVRLQIGAPVRAGVDGLGPAEDHHGSPWNVGMVVGGELRVDCVPGGWRKHGGGWGVRRQRGAAGEQGERAARREQEAESREAHELGGGGYRRRSECIV